MRCRIMDEVFQNCPVPPAPRAAPASASAAPQSLSPPAAGERLLGHEDHSVTALAQDVAIPTQLLVGPKAPSGKKTTVLGKVSSAIPSPFFRLATGHHAQSLLCPGSR